jgi:hypothetical protein
MGKVKALLNDFEEYKRIVEQRIYEELPVRERRPRELPHIKLRFKPWILRSKKPSKVVEVLKTWRR